mmetsp:Transcript_23344/g.45556  ORF Transcript_23344/g.45556 Transcript_23344/m.45556 type:complete len:296 (-) Transcript_23344:362-1249(-)
MPNQHTCFNSLKCNTISNLITGDIICNNCGEIISSSPYNDGIPLYNINKSNSIKFASDRLGKESSIHTTQDLHTSIGKNFKNFKTKIHVLNSNSVGLNCFKKIELVCNLMNLPNKVMILAKNLSTSYDYKIKTKKILAKAASYVFIASDFLSIETKLNKYAHNIPFLNEHDLYKCIKQMRKIIPNTKMKKYQEMHIIKKEKFLIFTDKYLQKIIKKIIIKPNEQHVITILKLFIFIFKKKINIFKYYGNFSSSKILAATIIIFIYLNNNNNKKFRLKKKNKKKMCMLMMMLLMKG